MSPGSFDEVDSRGLIEPRWPVHGRVRALATTRTSPGVSLPPYDRCNLGARSGDEPLAVVTNRRMLIDALALPSSPVWLRQVHGSAVMSVDRPVDVPVAIDAEPAFDAAVTSTAGVVLAVLAADCLPVLLASDDGTVIGAAHAGWRGMLDGVIEHTVAAMNADPGAIQAWLGPAIGPASYEVGDDVRQAFVGQDAAVRGSFIATRPGHWSCDLYGLARSHLDRAGITRVHGGGFDTFDDPIRFHSYRRDGSRSGRQAVLMWIEPVTRPG